MKHTLVLAIFALLPACASLGMGGSGEADRMAIWTEAHRAFEMQDFDRASALFGRLADDHGDTQEGRESVFYLATIRLDPRNAAWDPRPAESLLIRYLTVDTTTGMTPYRRAEAETFFQLARQLNMPPEQRVPGLQPDTTVVVAPERVIVRAQETRDLTAALERLRNLVAARDSTIEEQRAELERIRRTLIGGGVG
jgi:hypothetical protein